MCICLLTAYQKNGNRNLIRAEVVMTSAFIKMNIKGVALSAMPFYFTKNLGA